MFHKTLGNRKTQTGAFLRVIMLHVYTGKVIKQLSHILRLNSDTGIRHGKNHIIAVIRCPLTFQTKFNISTVRIFD